jgi:hypothetical protein
VVPEKPAPTPVAKKTAVVKLPGKGGENVENFDQVEKEVDTIDLYDDDEEEEEKEKAKKEEKSEVEFGKNLSLCFHYDTGTVISQPQIPAESKTSQFGIMDFWGFIFRAMGSLHSVLNSGSGLIWCGPDLLCEYTVCLHGIVAEKLIVMLL